jgi:hypothetical protein
MVNFADMKRRGGNLDKLKQLQQELEAPKQNNGPDERFWTLKVDKAGNGTATIRFLPAPGDESAPFIRYYQHGFKNPTTGQYYIEKSLSTIGQTDPVFEYNSKLWNTGLESNRAIARAQKRNTNFVSNIYVVKDPAQPENEGKVFLYRYGKKIFDMLNACMTPDEEAGEEAFDPFDLWTGANFILRANKNGEGAMAFRSYDKSKFAAAGPLLKDDDAMEKIWKSEYSLEALIAPDQFKSYEELKARLNKVLGLDGSGDETKADNVDVSTPPKRAPLAHKGADLDDDVPFKGGAKKAPAPQEEDDDELSIFKKLAEEG